MSTLKQVLPACPIHSLTSYKRYDLVQGGCPYRPAIAISKGAPQKGPLARVWLAAHLERKLTKSALLSTSIPKSVEAIVNVEVVPVALRLSGQLLLGVARIYSRKAKYLMDDCSDTLAKVKLAFRPAAVDMPAEHQHANNAAITRPQDNINEFDLLYGTFGYDWALEQANLPPPSATKAKKSTTAKNADITLPETQDLDEVPIFYDWDLMGPGLDSQNFGGESFHLDLDFGDAAEPVDRTPSKRKRADQDADRSVELGRDAAPESQRRSARASSALGPIDMEDLPDDTLRMSDAGNPFDMELPPDDFLPGLEASGDVDLGLNFDLPLDGGLENPLSTPIRQSTPRPADDENAENIAPQEDPLADLTPKTGKRIADAAARLARQEAAQRPRKKVKKASKQIVDQVTELESQTRKSTDGSAFETQLISRSTKEGYEERVRQGLISPPNFLPSNRLHLRLLEINANPSAHYLPHFKEGNTEFIIAAPPGLAPQLQALFKFPANALRRKRSDAGEESPSKRIRATPDVEVGMRDQSQLDLSGGVDLQPFADFGAGDAFDQSPDNQFRFDLGEHEVPLNDDLARRDREPSVFSTYSNRLPEESPARSAFADEDTMARGAGLLAVFDDLRLQPNPFTTVSQNQTPAKGTASQNVTPHSTRSRGPIWSKSTIAAANVIHKEVQDESAQMSFKSAAKEASKRAAASFFFELLVLSSRDCIKVDQKEANGDINISAKPRFFDVLDENVVAVAPSVIASRAATPTPIRVNGS